MHFLVVDDHSGDGDSVTRLLAGAFDDAVVTRVETADAYRQALSAGPVDVVLTEHALGWIDWRQVLGDVQARWCCVPVIMVTGSGSERVAVEGFRAGLSDYVRKDAVGEELIAAVRHARDQKAEEQRLRESERRLAFIAEHSEDCTFLQDLDLRYVWVSQPSGPCAIDAYLGRTDLEMEGPPAQRARLCELKRRVIATGQAATVALAFDAQGERRHCHATFKPWRNPVGQMVGVAGYVRDVTVQKQAAAALRQEQARYRTLFESLDQGFCLIEVLFDAEDRPIDYRFLESNPAFERQAGFKVVAGNRMREIAPEHEAHWFETYGRVALTGEPVRVQSWAAVFGRYYDVYACRVGSPEQRQVMVLFSDITERKQSEAALQSYAVQLEAANEANRILLQEINHRVKNSLTAILSLIFAEQGRLAQETCTDADADGDLDVTASSGPDACSRPNACAGPHARCHAALADLGERVRSLATAHSLLSENAWRPLRVADLVPAVIRAATPALPGSKRVVLDVTEAPVVVTPEQAHHLALVISELATNTVKYGRGADGVRIHVEIGVDQGDVRIVYRNGGPGYTEAVLNGTAHSVGLGIVDKLVRHSLRGSWAIWNDGGPVTEIRFPADPEANRIAACEGALTE